MDKATIKQLRAGFFKVLKGHKRLAPDTVKQMFDQTVLSSMLDEPAPRANRKPKVVKQKKPSNKTTTQQQPVS